MKNIKCLDYESEATEDWVYSGMISFKMPVVGREKNSPKVYIIVISICFPTVNVFLEGDRAGGWNFWMRQALYGGEVESPAVERDPERCSLGSWPPHGVCYEGPHNKIPRIPNNSTESNHGFRLIHSLSPCIYPILSFPYCNPTEEFFSTWRWKVHNRLLTNNHASPGYRWCMQWCHRRPMSGLYLPYQIFPRCLANEHIHYDVDENLWPNPQDRVDEDIEEQWGTLQLTCYCRPTVFFYLFFL